MKEARTCRMTYSELYLYFLLCDSQTSTRRLLHLQFHDWCLRGLLKTYFQLLLHTHVFGFKSWIFHSYLASWSLPNISPFQSYLHILQSHLPFSTIFVRNWNKHLKWVKNIYLQERNIYLQFRKTYMFWFIFLTVCCWLSTCAMVPLICFRSFFDALT